MENVFKMTANLLAVILLAAVKETLGSSNKYISAPVPVETLLATGVASKNYSGVNDVLCALRAALDGIPYPTLCVHSTSGQCLLLNSTYPALFNRTFLGSSDYNCYVRETCPQCKRVAQPCPATFDWVEDVGCVAVVETDLLYASAQTSCPGGSQLVSLYSDNFFKLADYVYHKSHQPTGSATGRYQVGLHRFNHVWTWRTGQVMSGLPGTSPWAVDEPNEDYDCAFIMYNSGSMPALEDLPCTRFSWYVCALQ